MKYSLLSSCLFAGLWVQACPTAERNSQKSPTQAVAEPPKVDSMVGDTVTNQQGEKLVMAYDNAAHTARFVLKGEVIDLRQDTTASGIRYRNEQYDYTEHGGVMILKKGDHILFSNQPYGVHCTPS